MGEIFTTIDLVIFFAALIGVMAVGLIAGRKENTSEDYFLAGRGIPWWGVAGSIFGSNVSANHMVGMMGIGFSIGFAQSHFELGAIFGLMALCYLFLPVYRKLKLYTLSEYLGQRYDERSRVVYAVIMVIIMTMVQMVPGLYIGARSICILMGGDAIEAVGPIETTEDLRIIPESVTQKQDVNQSYYNVFVIALAVVAAGYTVFGGLKAVIWTDVIQSMLLLAAGIGVAILTFDQIGGWGAMRAIDDAAAQKMTLYRPMNHPKLPWTGVFTGLLALHCFYWGTNQFIVQRALGAKSDAEARLGIVAAGFLKLLIPFFAIGTGIAAFYLFNEKKMDVDPDAAFPELVKLVIPLGSGIIGLIAAGLIGAILSSIDSMMNSAATIITVDLYKRYINPEATDKQMILIGRVSIVVFMLLAAVMAIVILDPNAKDNFFLKIVDYQGYLTPGLLVAFLMGMFWQRGTGTGAFTTMIAGIFFSWLVEYSYKKYFVTLPGVEDALGGQLNFFHRVFVVILLCIVVHVVVSLLTKPDPEKSRLVWTDLGGHAPGDLKNLLCAILISIGVYASLGWLMVYDFLSPTLCAFLGAIWTVGVFSVRLYRMLIKEGAVEISSLMKQDRFWAGILCALAVFMHFYFY